MVLVYKTNIDSKSKARHTEKQLNKILPAETWNFDLEDCDNILRVVSENDVTKILKAEMKKFGIEIPKMSVEIKYPKSYILLFQDLILFLG